MNQYRVRSTLVLRNVNRYLTTATTGGGDIHTTVYAYLYLLNRFLRNLNRHPRPRQREEGRYVKQSARLVVYCYYASVKGRHIAKTCSNSSSKRFECSACLKIGFTVDTPLIVRTVHTILSSYRQCLRARTLRSV